MRRLHNETELCKYINIALLGYWTYLPTRELYRLEMPPPIRSFDPRIPNDSKKTLPQKRRAPFHCAENKGQAAGKNTQNRGSGAVDGKDRGDQLRQETDKFDWTKYQNGNKGKEITEKDEPFQKARVGLKQSKYSLSGWTTCMISHFNAKTYESISIKTIPS
jgi:hypothetical protein